MRNRRNRGSGNPGVVCDCLENRVLFSTINWTNKGTTSSDTDHFNSSFGVNADKAREIVQRAVDDWERVIVNFNRPAGGIGNVLNVAIDAQDLVDFGKLGATSVSAYDSSGKPQTATVKLDDNAGGAGGWYFDPAPGPAFRPDDSEWTFIQSPFAAKNILLNSDLYAVTLHELGHAMGLSSSSTRLSSMATDIGDDPVDSGSGHLFTLNTDADPLAEYTYTNAGGVHLYEGPSVGGCPTHPLDIMNSGRANEGRRLISNTIATLLRDVYAYTITLPSQLNTYYVQFDDTNNTLTITGDINENGNDDDTINVYMSTSSQVVEVNGTREGISWIEFTTLAINANQGNDLIMLDSIRGGAVTPTTVNGGSGHDTLQLCNQTGDLSECFGPITFSPNVGTDSVYLRDANEARADTYTITPLTVARPAFTLTLTEPVENLNLTGQTGINECRLTASPLTRYYYDGGAGTDFLAFVETASTTGAAYTIRNGIVERPGYPDTTFPSSTEIVRFDAGSGNDTFTFIPGDIFPLIGFNGNGGNDSILIDDRANTGADNYFWWGNFFSKQLAGVPGGGNLPMPQMSGIETSILQLNDDNNALEMYYSDGNTFIFTNGGNDTISLWDGTATINTGSEVASAVAPFGDSISVNPDAASGEDNPATVIVAQDDDVRSLSVMSASTVGTLRVTSGAVLVRSAGSGSALTLTGVIDLAGGALLVRSPGPTQASWRTALIAGRNGGAWNGTSLSGAVNSSLASATQLNDGVGYGLGSEISPTTTIGSFTIGATDALLRYTLEGDANLDGRVNANDFSRLAANFGRTGRVWSQGDFNYDGTVNAGDFSRLAGNFGAVAGEPDLLLATADIDRFSRHLIELE